MKPTGRRTLAQTVGGEAEDAAARFLERKGMQIVERNFRTRFGEIDLVARDGESLVFVEVRLRSSARYGGGAGSIDERKRAKVISAARIFLSRIKPMPPCRFDVVTLDGAAPEWLRGAFEVS